MVPHPVISEQPALHTSTPTRPPSCIQINANARPLPMPYNCALFHGPQLLLFLQLCFRHISQQTIIQFWPNLMKKFSICQVHQSHPRVLKHLVLPAVQQTILGTFRIGFDRILTSLPWTALRSRLLLRDHSIWSSHVQLEHLYQFVYLLLIRVRCYDQPAKLLLKSLCKNQLVSQLCFISLKNKFYINPGTIAAQWF